MFLRHLGSQKRRPLSFFQTNKFKTIWPAGYTKRTDRWMTYRNITARCRAAHGKLFIIYDFSRLTTRLINRTYVDIFSPTRSVSQLSLHKRWFTIILADQSIWADGNFLTSALNLIFVTSAHRSVSILPKTATYSAQQSALIHAPLRSAPHLVINNSSVLF